MADLNLSVSDSSGLTESTPSPSYPIIKLIQTFAQGSSSAISFTSSTKFSTSAGNLLIYCVGVNANANQGIDAVSDNGGNTWTQVAISPNGKASIWAVSNAAGITQFTVRASAATNMIGQFYEIQDASSVDITYGFSQTGSNTQNGNGFYSSTDSTPTLTTPADLAIAIVAGFTPASSARFLTAQFNSGVGTQNIQNQLTNGVVDIATCALILNSAAPISYGWSRQINGTNNVVAIATWKPAYWVINVNDSLAATDTVYVTAPFDPVTTLAIRVQDDTTITESIGRNVPGYSLPISGISDTTSITESIIRDLVGGSYSVTLASSSAVTESIYIQITPINVSDTSPITESVTVTSPHFDVSKSDSSTVTENVGIMADENVNVSETSGVTENVVLAVTGGTTDLSVNVNDTLTVTENLVLMVESFIAKSDATTVTENVVMAQALQVNTSDSTTVSDFPAPASNNYQNVRSFTIDHTKVGSSDSTNFPALVSGTYAYLATIANGGKVYNSNGYDIAFYSDAALTTKLDWEIDTYTASSGAVNFWVRIPTLSHTTDTVFYMAYAKASQVLIDQSNRTGVWDSNFKGVYHLADGTTLSGLDSTSGAHNTTTTTATATTGAVNGAASFDGTTGKKLVAPNSSDFDIQSANATIQFWIRLTSLGGSGVSPMSMGASGVTGWYSFVNSNGSIMLGLETSGADHAMTSNASVIGTGTSYHVALVRTGTSTGAIYINGSSVSIASNTLANATSDTTHSLNIGSYSASSGFEVNGWMDEVRYSNTARSADWILAEYNNQNSPSTFYSVSPELLLVNVNDTATVTENVVTAQALQINKSDTTTVTDSTGEMAESYINKSDTSTVTENVVVAQALQINKSDTSTVTDSVRVYEFISFTDFRTITIDHTKVGSTDSTNFPVLISSTYSFLKTTANGGKVQNSSGYDIGFYQDSALTVRLNWETELYTASTGQVVYWVQVPTVSASTDTVIYMAYGAATVSTDQSNKTATWDSNYRDIWHLAGNSNDSKGTSTGTDTFVSYSTSDGKIGQGANYNGSTAYTTLANAPASGGTSMTISAWVKYTATTLRNTVVYGQNGTGNPLWEISIDGAVATGKLRAGFRGNDGATALPQSSSAYNDGNWHYVVGTKSATQSICYVDGSSVATDNTATTDPFLGDTQFYIGANNGHGNNWNGSIDEVRISTSVRSADWITAEYNNQNKPDKGDYGTTGFFWLDAEVVTVSDFSTVTDQPVVAIAKQINVNDTTAVTDNTPVVLESNINKSDSTTVAENLPMMVESYVNKSDSSTVTDNTPVVIEGNISKSDTTALTDSTPVMVESYITKSDSTTVTENVVTMVENSVNKSDSSIVTDSSPMMVESYITKSDSTTVTENTPLTMESYINKSDSTTIIDVPQALLVSNPIVSDTTTVTDTPTVQFDLNLTTSDSSTVTESVSVAIVNANDLNVTVSDSSAVTEFVQVQFTGSINVSDASGVTDNTPVVVESDINKSDTSIVTDSPILTGESNINSSDTSGVTENVVVTITAVSDLNLSCFDTSAATENVVVTIASVSDLSANVSDTTTPTENTVVIILGATLLAAVSDQTSVSDAVIVVIAQLMTTGLLEFFE